MEAAEDALRLKSFRVLGGRLLFDGVKNSYRSYPARWTFD
jgi:hypothetical protein